MKPSSVKMADIVIVLIRKSNAPLTFKTFFRKAIAFLTRAKNEEPTRAVHTGLIVMMDGVPYVLEALWTVEMTPYSDWVKKHHSFCIWRNNNLTFHDCKNIQKVAMSYLGARYGFLKILLHALDGVIMKFMNKEYFLFRRLIHNKKIPICSWLNAYAYYEGAGEDFGCDYDWASPDTISDYVKKSNEYSKVVTKIDSKGL